MWTALVLAPSFLCACPTTAIAHDQTFQAQAWGGVQLADKSLVNVYVVAKQTLYHDGRKSTSGMIALTGAKVRLYGVVLDAEFHNTHVTLQVPSNNGPGTTVDLCACGHGPFGSIGWTAPTSKLPETDMVAGMVTIDGPPASTLPPVTNITVTGSDDSALIEFDAVAGAKDYRVYEAGNPHRQKYAGFTPPPYYVDATNRPDPTHTTPRRYGIQWNGIDPAKGVNLVVEAVDQLGPFVHPMAMLRMAEHETHVHNGHGDPANSPQALARGTVTVRPSDLKPLIAPPDAEQVFLETWRGATPFVPTGRNPRLPGSPAQSVGEYMEFSNGRWRASAWRPRPDGIGVFVEDGHMMTVNADAAGVADTTFSLEPMAAFDIGGGKTLRVEWEVDAVSTSRRFTSLSVIPAESEILDPAEVWRRPVNTVGRTFTWTIGEESNTLWYQDPKPLDAAGNWPGPQLIGGGTWAEYWPDNARKFFDHWGPMANGTALDIDKRHRFVLELTNTGDRTHVLVCEMDMKGAVLSRLEKDVPPLGYDRTRVFFNHQVYHSALEHVEIGWAAVYNPYWYWRMPSADERHWDSFIGYVKPKRTSLALPVDLEGFPVNRCGCPEHWRPSLVRA